jgi:hypothetical protein
METIRILLYTDKADISTGSHLWGLDSLQRFVVLKLKGIANVTFTMRNRHFNYKHHRPQNGATPLTSSLLSHYDELWIFAALQANTASEPLNQLEAAEIAALQTWMKKKGVFITGDHSEAFRGETCKDDHSNFINLGAAIGRGIPRAGKLRVWDGPPTGCYEGLPLDLRDNHNTQEGSDRNNLDRMNLQSDRFPQTLRLTPSTPPHRLFWWHVDPHSKAVVPITKFPDHIHEGDLTDPEKMEDWPEECDSPSIVAWGRDKRLFNEERYYRLVSVYDGDANDLGRIVADSSFHHYIDRNIFDIPALIDQDPEPGSDLDQIAQYYGNLALWLAPRKLRKRLAWNLFLWCASHPDVMEEKSNGPSVLGQTSMNLLLSEIGFDNLNRLLAPSGLERSDTLIHGLLAQLFLGQEGPATIVSPELAVGHVVQEYHRYFDEIGLSDPGWGTTDLPQTAIVLRGLEKAWINLPAAEGVLALFRAAAEQLNNGD